jgi:hypothetical protein
LTNNYTRVPQNDNSDNIASNLNNIGPVFIATEANPVKDINNFNAVLNQVEKIKRACPNCTVFLSITLDEIYEENRFYLNKTKYQNYANPDILNLIDGFAFGIDSRFSKTREKSSLCGGDTILIHEVVPLISYINREFNKSTFIYYVYLPNTADCVYADNDYVNLYEQFFLSLPYLVSEGLMGFTPQPFYESSSIFPCKDCALTTYNTSSNKIEDAKYRFQVWFNLCSQYYVGTVKQGASTTIPESNRRLIMRYNANAPNMCNLIVAETGYSINPIRPLSAINIDITSKQPQFYSCSSCIDFSQPTSIINNLSYSLPSDACSNTSNVYSYVSSYDGDGVIARAIAYLYSKGDRCYIEYSNATGISIDQTIEDAYREAQCGKIEKRYGNDCSLTSPPSSNAQPCKIKRMGIYGLDYKPTKWYISNNVNTPPEILNCNKDNFNPFNVNDSSCVFMEKFNRAYEVSDNKANALKFPQNDSEKRQLTAVLTAMYIVNTGAIELADIYENIKNSGGSCDRMGSKARDLCCTLTSSSSSSSSSSSTSYTLTNSACLGTFSEFLKSIETKEQYKDAIKAASLYTQFYKTCEDCYSSEWKKNTCDAARKFGIDPVTLSQMGC